MASLLSALLLLGGCATTMHGNEAVSPNLGQWLDESSDDAAVRFHILAGDMAAQRGMADVASRQYVEALKYTSNRTLARRATRIALFADEPALAYKAARIWARQTPDSLNAGRIATRLALVAGDAQHLPDFCRAVIANAQTREDGYRMLADVLSGKPEHADLAVSTLQSLAQRDRDSAAAWYATGLVAMRYGRIEVADRASRRARDRAPDWEQAVLLRSAVLIHNGRTARAQSLVARLSGSKTKRSQYHLALARLLLDEGLRETALAEFEQALDLQPDNDQARHGLAILALSLRRLDQAEQAFLRLYRDDVHVNDAAYYLGAIHERRQDYIGAKTWYDRVSGGSHKFNAQIRAIQAHAASGHLSQARDRIHALQAQFPDRAGQLYAAEGRMLAAADRQREALTVYDAGLEKVPDDDDLLYGRSLALSKLGHVDRARADLEQVLENKPDSVRALNALGYLLTNHSTAYEKALGYIRKALQASPNNPAILDSMGWVQYRLGHAEKALTYLRRAYRDYPDPEVAAHLGEVLWQLGHRDQARKVWQGSLSEHPDNDTLKETIARFSS